MRRTAVKTVLVVDDDPLARESLAEVLRFAGYAVRTASNGREALDLALSIAPKPWAMVLDLDMPEMNGHELVRVLRSHRRLISLPVILLTGESLVADEVRVGCTAFLRKPASPEALLDSLDALGEEKKEISSG